MYLQLVVLLCNIHTTATAASPSHTTTIVYVCTSIVALATSHFLFNVRQFACPTKQK